MEASRDYNPAPLLETIQARVFAINSTDDERNPPELGIMECEIKRMKQGRYILILSGPETRGHVTMGFAKLWKQYLAELLQPSKWAPKRHGRLATLTIEKDHRPATCGGPELAGSVHRILPEMVLRACTRSQRKFQSATRKVLD
jgi:hypothetical protein